MKGSATLDLINEALSCYHEMANRLLTASLTIELSGSDRHMTVEDFEVVQKEINLTIEKLRESKSALSQLQLILNNTGSQQALHRLFSLEDDVSVA